MLRTASDFRIPQQEWDSAKDEARRIMIARAKSKRTIPYSELVKGITAVRFAARDSRLDHFLGEISSEEVNAGRGMLTVVVVHKTGDMRPGPGFFQLAQRLGRNTSDLEKCWIQELNFVFRAWAERPVKG